MNKTQIVALRVRSRGGSCEANRTGSSGALWWRLAFLPHSSLPTHHLQLHASPDLLCHVSWQPGKLNFVCKNSADIASLLHRELTLLSPKCFHWCRLHILVHACSCLSVSSRGRNCLMHLCLCRGLSRTKHRLGTCLYCSISMDPQVYSAPGKSSRSSEKCD